MKVDPFDWPAQNRADCMNLDVLDAKRDLVATRTRDMRPKTRDMSSNLQNSDIEGKFTHRR